MQNNYRVIIERPGHPINFVHVCVCTVQFAGSLGKLTVSSVNNPRKMIDAVVTSRSDDEVRDLSHWVTLCVGGGICRFKCVCSV